VTKYWLIAALTSSIVACTVVDRPNPVPAAPVDAAEIARGRYLFTAANCQGCHTDTAHHGAFLAGGRAIPSSFGTFYTRNITPDPIDGIGRWTDAQFLRALRDGVSPQGDYYYPAFPYPAFTRMSDADIRAIKAFLMTQPPVAQPNRPHALHFPWSIRVLLWPWRQLYFHPGVFAVDPAHGADWNRGAYLVQAVAHCGECHTPRTALGGLIVSRAFAGYKMPGQPGPAAPNISQNRKVGIGAWEIDDTTFFLKTGVTPAGDVIGGRMAEVIERTATLTPDDQRDIAVYLKAIPAVQ
jgi:mono/diheme cytochrome c family protein